MTSIHAITCDNISIEFSGKQILDNFSMHITAGRIHALLGRNGAGKSTCFKIILGLEDRNSGDVRILGEPRTRDSLIHIGASINGPALYQHLSAKDNLLVHTKLLGLSAAEADQALAMVGLHDTKKKKVRDFSTGMKARLALAIAMLGSPQILILDEPQNGLDPQGIADLRHFLQDWTQHGGTVLVSSHQLGEIARLADDITVLSQGKNVYSGPLAEFSATGDLEERFLSLTGEA